MNNVIENVTTVQTAIQGSLQDISIHLEEMAKKVD